MLEALHPFRNTPIGTVEYIREFGHKPLGVRKDPRPPAHCRICEQPVGLRGGKDTNTVLHFAHFPKAMFCPTKEPAGKPYIQLHPRVEDPTRSAALKNSVAASWANYFIKMRELVPCLSPEEFISLIERANEHRIWVYASLEAWQIPYVLVMLADFPTHTSVKIKGVPARKYWFRFFFDAQIRHIQDLWIYPRTTVRFFRSSYKQHGRGMPRLTDLKFTRELPLTADYLDVEAVVASVMAHRLIPKALERLLS